MFVGITYLAHRMNVRPSLKIPVVGQIAHATFGGGIGFGVVQVMTALILVLAANTDRKSTRLNSSHSQISYAVFCLKKKKNIRIRRHQISVLTLMRPTFPHQ